MGWYQLELTKHGEHCTYRIHVKRWHPALWREAFRTIRAGGGSVLEALYYTFVFIRTLGKKKR